MPEPVERPTLGPVPSLVPPGAAQTWPSGRPSSLPRNSVPLAQWGSSSIAMLDGRPISFWRIYEEQPWVAAAVNGIARQWARLPRKAFERVDDDHRRYARDSGLGRLIRRPNPAGGRSSTELGWEIAVGMLVNGNAVERVHRPGAGREPDRLTRMDWRYTIPHVLGGVVVLWEYRPPDGPVEFLGPEEVLHFRWGSPTGPIGISPLQQLGVTIRSEHAAQSYGEASFRNGARVGVGIVLDPNVKADDPAVRDGLRAEVIGNHGGLEKAFSPVILGGGVTDVKTLGTQTAVEAELIDQRKVNREEVAAVYGTPPPLIGILEHATLANVGEFHKMLYRTTLGPWLSLEAGVYDAQLVARVAQWDAAGLYVEHELGEVLKGDPKERMDAYRIAIGAGVLTLNDVRRLENLPPYDSELADQPLVMGNNVRPLDALLSGDGITDPLRATLEEMIAAELEQAGLNGSSPDRAAEIVTRALDTVGGER